MLFVTLLNGEPAWFTHSAAFADPQGLVSKVLALLGFVLKLQRISFCTGMARSTNSMTCQGLGGDKLSFPTTNHQGMEHLVFRCSFAGKAYSGNVYSGAGLLVWFWVDLLNPFNETQVLHDHDHYCAGRLRVSRARFKVRRPLLRRQIVKKMAGTCLLLSLSFMFQGRLSMKWVAEELRSAVPGSWEMIVFPHLLSASIACALWHIGANQSSGLGCPF